MKYNTVDIQIKKDKKDDGGFHFIVHQYTNGMDRVRVKTVPMSLGFYHYPVSMNDEVAFEKLKEKMITDRTDTIEELTIAVEKLRKLKITDTLFNYVPCK